MYQYSFAASLLIIWTVELSQQTILECKKSVQGTDYRGLVNVTKSKLVCQSWALQTPYKHDFTDHRRFPDEDFKEIGNHCRNPDQESEGPWCYTTDPGTRWEFCDVPRCSDFPECKITQKGEEYRGHVAVTYSGKTCQSWGEIPKETLISLSASGRSLLSSDENYCRANPHPSEDPSGPWCFVDEGPEGSWELCNIPWCKPSSPCKTKESGARYAGTVSVTKSGFPCQRWDKQAPHSHGQSPNSFPVNSLTEANNYCRNPDGEPGPWCYTLDPDVRWELCDVPLCGDCKVTDQGLEYAGTLAVTAEGDSCLSWIEAAKMDPDVSDPKKFPDASLADAGNYCRNPNRRSGGPWCYSSASGSWDFCDLQLCQGLSCAASGNEEAKVKQNPLPRRVRHVVNIGIDGFHPCFVNAPNGAPNILHRLGDQGSWTLTKGRTALETVSAPGWSNIISGMPVVTTGIYSNSYRPVHMGFDWPITPAYGPSIPTPTVFTTLKAYDNNIRYMTSYGVPGSLDNDNFCDPSRTPGGYHKCDEINVRKSTAYLTQILKSAESSYTLIYIGNVDETGHSLGWCGEQYLKQVDWTDERVGEILNAIEDGRQNPYDDVLVILSTDHGGSGKGHGNKADSDLQVPLFLRGGNIKKNYQFTKEVRNQDIAPTAVHLMGFPPNPWWKGDVIQEALIVKN